MIYDFIIYLIQEYLKSNDNLQLKEIIKNFTKIRYEYLYHFLSTTELCTDDIIFKGPCNINNITDVEYLNEIVFMEFSHMNYCNICLAGARYGSDTIENIRYLPYDISKCFANNMTSVIKSLFTNFKASNYYLYRFKINKDIEND